jgi:hypothetical protein
LILQRSLHTLRQAEYGMGTMHPCRMSSLRSSSSPDPRPGLCRGLNIRRTKANGAPCLNTLKLYDPQSKGHSRTSLGLHFCEGGRRFGGASSGREERDAGRTGTSGSTPALATMRRPSGFSQTSWPRVVRPTLTQPH